MFKEGDQAASGSENVPGTRSTLGRPRSSLMFGKEMQVRKAGRGAFLMNLVNLGEML